MQVSMWTSYLIELLPREMVSVLVEHGWSTAEISGEHGHDLLKLGDPAKVGAEFAAYAADQGLTFPQGHFYLCTKGFRPEDLDGRKAADIAPESDADFEVEQDRMKRWIDLFNALGIKAGVLHIGAPGRHQAGWSSERILERRVQALQGVAEYARGGVTRICLENMSSSYGEFATVADINRVIDAAGYDNVGICLDTGHANIANVNVPAFIREAGARLEALHIADNLGQGDDHMLPYGRGTVPWKETMQALAEIDCQALFNFEVPGENRCPMPIRLAKLSYARQLAELMVGTVEAETE